MNITYVILPRLDVHYVFVPVGNALQPRTHRAIGPREETKAPSRQRGACLPIEGRGQPPHHDQRAGRRGCGPYLRLKDGANDDLQK
jgi:hypothetical protein